MDTELLKTFLEVSRTRHFGRAAEALYLTQSAVSFRIRQLENQLGVNLFTRHRNNIRLTTAGEKLLPYAETLMNTWQAARKEVAHTSRHNEFSIGASASLWECMLNLAGATVPTTGAAKRPAVRSQNRSTAIACEATS